MQTVALILVIAVVFPSAAAFAADGADAKAAEPAARPVKIVAFGDSITEGWGATDPARTTYPAVLQRMLDEKYGKGRYEVVNAGISGQDTRKALTRLDALLEKEKPDWMLIGYGTNDLWTGRGIEPAETKANLTEIIRRIKAAGSKAILATLPPASSVDQKVTVRNEIIREVARETGVPSTTSTAPSRTCSKPPAAVKSPSHGKRSTCRKRTSYTPTTRGTSSSRRSGWPRSKRPPSPHRQRRSSPESPRLPARRSLHRHPVPSCHSHRRTDAHVGADFMSALLCRRPLPSGISPVTP